MDNMRVHMDMHVPFEHVKNGIGFEYIALSGPLLALGSQVAPDEL